MISEIEMTSAGSVLYWTRAKSYESRNQAKSNVESESKATEESRVKSSGQEPTWTAGPVTDLE